MFLTGHRHRSHEVSKLMWEYGRRDGIVHRGPNAGINFFFIFATYSLQIQAGTSAGEEIS